MGRIEALSVLKEQEGMDFLAELYGNVIENVEKSTVASLLKNYDLSGNLQSGTVEAKRFANAESKDYGTARANAAGEGVTAKPVTVAIDVDREIVEEIEAKDVSLYGVEDLLQRRAKNHQLTMRRELERAFFTEAAESGDEFAPDGANPGEKLEALIQEIETTRNKFVDGVPRDMIAVVMDTASYGEIRGYLDAGVGNSNIDTALAEFGKFHGVDIFPSVYLPEGVGAVAMVRGAVAQPVLSFPYKAEEIQLSKAMGVSLFYNYGTKAVTPDLIKWVAN